MSYRNPQIIVDRSAEIWAQGIAKVGDVLNRGIEAYFAAKKKGEEVQKKKDEAINTTMIQGDLKQSALRNQMAKKIKDVSLQEKFTKRAELLANGDDENKGAIWYNTQLTLNPPTDKGLLKEYKDKVKDYQKYMANSAQEIGYVMSALETTKNLSAQQLVDGYAVAGKDGGGELQNLMAMRALENKALEGFDYEKDLVYNEDGTNSLKVVGYLDKDSKTYKAWEKTGIFKNQDLEYTKDGKIKISWERNLAKWGEDGSFVNEISPAVDINSVMEGTGLINKNGSANDNLYVTPTVQQKLKNQDGTESINTEKVLDYNKLYNNSAFKAEIQSKAAGLDAMLEQDQIDFVRSRFGWGDIKTKDFFNKSRKDRLAFYEGQLEMEAVKKLGSFRKATAQDVKTLYEVMPGIKEGDPIIFKQISTQTIEPPRKETTNVSESPKIAKDYIESFLIDPVSFLEDRFSVGKEDSVYKEMSFKDGLITVRPPDKEFKVGKGEDSTIELEEQEEESFPINSSQGKRLLRDLIQKEVGSDKAGREIMRIIDKTFPKSSKTSFTDALENNFPLTQKQQQKVNQEFN